MDGNAAHPAAGALTSSLATSDSPATDPPPTGSTSDAPAADASVVVPGIEAPAEAAFSVVPYRGPRSLRDLIAGDPPAMPSASAVAVVVPKKTAPAGKSSTKSLNAPAPAAPGEVRAKRLADTVPTIIRVNADRRVLQRMTLIQREAFFRDREAQRIGAVREVKCGGGWCDLLTKEEIV